MRGKLQLSLDQLAVDSFDTTAAEKNEKGTIFGEQCTCPTACTCPGCPTCEGAATCNASCNGTCGNTCQASCYGTCDASCDCGGTQFDYTCNGYGTCGVYPCKIVP
ncbi:MAG TPA: hypothetical protein VFQ39_19635 [Longimicrobium sp.]|nr:hypothetical protein [Longimicrobium sp.]